MKKKWSRTKNWILFIFGIAIIVLGVLFPALNIKNENPLYYTIDTNIQGTARWTYQVTIYDKDKIFENKLDHIAVMFKQKNSKYFLQNVRDGITKTNKDGIIAYEFSITLDSPVALNVSGIHNVQAFGDNNLVKTATLYQDLEKSHSADVAIIICSSIIGGLITIDAIIKFIIGSKTVDSLMTTGDDDIDTIAKNFKAIVEQTKTPKLKVCEYCGSSNKLEATKCENCGARLK